MTCPAIHWRCQYCFPFTVAIMQYLHYVYECCAWLSQLKRDKIKSWPCESLPAFISPVVKLLKISSLNLNGCCLIDTQTLITRHYKLQQLFIIWYTTRDLLMRGHNAHCIMGKCYQTNAMQYEIAHGHVSSDLMKWVKWLHTNTI